MYFNYLKISIFMYYCIVIFNNEQHICLAQIPMAKRTTISLSVEEIKELRELAKEEHRPISRQIVYMMELYKKRQREK
jgi:hypothetical protein